MKKITYNNKQYVLNDPQYPVEETVTDTDMNEIKEVVNFNADETLEENIKIKEQLERTQSALINITTPKSSNINVKDSSDLNAKVDVYGISRQKTRSGKNKANSSAYNYDTVSYQDLDVNLENNEFTISTDSLRIVTEYVKVPIKITENGTYTFGLELKANTSGATAQALVYDSTNKKIIGSPLQNDTTTYAKKTTTTTIDDTVDKSNINVLLYCNGTVGNAYSYSYKNIFVNPGQDDEFEQHGASPTPEFPSEIENVEGNVDITVCNKNLYDGKIVNVASDGEKTVFASNYISTFIKSIPGKSYSISKKVQTSRFRVAFSKEIPNVNAVPLYGGYMGTEFDNKLKIENMVAPAETNYMLVYVSNLSENISNIDLQIEEDNAATEYVEHKEQLITFPLAEGQRLADRDKFADDGIHHVRKQIELDGTENWGVIYENIFWIEFSDTKLFTSAIMTHFKYAKKSLTELLDNEFTTSAGQRHAFWIKKEGMTLEEFKSFLSQQKQAGIPVIVEYELETEEIEAYTEEQQEAYNQLQNVLPYKPVTNVFTDKAQLVFKYIADTKTYVDNQYNALANQVLELAGGN